MSSLQEVQAIQILEDALVAGEYGILVEVSSPTPILGLTSRAKQILYQTKKGSDRFRDLVIKFCPFNPDTHLWIYVGEEKSEIDTLNTPSNQILDL